MDIKKFNSDFNRNYKQLYNLENEAITDILSEIFDNKINDPVFKNIVVKLCNYRKDFIASNREAAAFVLTYNNYI